MASKCGNARRRRIRACAGQSRAQSRARDTVLSEVLGASFGARGVPPARRTRRALAEIFPCGRLQSSLHVPGPTEPGRDLPGAPGCRQPRAENWLRTLQFAWLTRVRTASDRPLANDVRGT